MNIPPTLTDLDALYAACAECPDDETPRLVAADWLDDHQEGARAAIFRAVVSVRRNEAAPPIAQPDTYPVGRTPSDGWRLVAPDIEALAAAPERTPAYRARLERLLRGDVPLAPENLEPALRLQYDLQVQRLASLGLLEERDGAPGITAIDGRHYPLPAFEDVLARMRTPDLQTKLTQGFDTLLLVPFGISFQRFTDAWREGLRRNAVTLRRAGPFNVGFPLWVWDGYGAEDLVYDPRSFDARHGGRTKEQILAQDGRGWDVLLAEGALQNLPGAGQGQTVGGRAQIECGRTPAQYLRDLRTRGETGLTPEAYILQFLDALERQGHVLDIQTYTSLTGAFLSASRFVPGAYWIPEVGRANLRRVDPGYRLAYCGVRAAVRVI